MGKKNNRKPSAINLSTLKPHPPRMQVSQAMLEGFHPPKIQPRSLNQGKNIHHIARAKRDLLLLEV
jgi:hypothetical protein